MMYKESQGIYQTYIDKQEYEKNLQNKTNSKDQSSSLLQESECKKLIKNTKINQKYSQIYISIEKDKVEELQ